MIARATWNPLTGTYKTGDKRYIGLVMLDADKYWANFCTVIGRSDLIKDPRFFDMAARKENARECVEILDAVFASKDYAKWCEILKDATGVWAPLQSPLEVHEDEQVLANGYLADVEMINGKSLRLVTTPVEFDERPNQPTRAPEHGEHTETALLELGFTWDEISSIKATGVMG